MSQKKVKLFLFLIILIAFVLRFYQLGKVPPSLGWDEASWGYNAYSILKTGQDEYGKSFPLVFKSFGDHQSTIYTYLTVLPVAILGLNEFAVRSLAAIFGVISVGLIFVVVRKLFSGFKDKEVVGLLSSLVLALSPWHFCYSRGAWEVNLLLTFLLLGIYFFLKARKTQTYFFWWSAFFFGLCFYVYNSIVLLIPLVILGLISLYRSKIKQQNSKTLIISLLILGLMALPALGLSFSNNSKEGLRAMSLFDNLRSVEEVEKISNEAKVSLSSPGYQLFYSEPVYFAREFLDRYLNHFSGRFLIFEGDWVNPRYGVPFAGVLNHFDLLFLLIGAYFLISRKVKGQGLIWFLLLLAPLPAAFSRELIQATRSYLMVLPLTIIIAFGIYFTYSTLIKKKNLLAYGLLLFLTLGYLFSFTYFLDQYFTHMPVKNSSSWQYGYKQAVEFLENEAQNYDRVVFTRKYGQPQTYYLFYNQYESQEDQLEKNNPVEFREIYWPKERELEKTLFVGTEHELPKQDIDPNQAKILKEINFLNGEVAFRIVGTN